MSDDKKKSKKPPEGGEERTVFVPSGQTEAPGAPAPVEAAAEPPAAEAEAPAAAESPAVEPEAPAAVEPPAAEPEAPAASEAAASAEATPAATEGEAADKVTSAGATQANFVAREAKAIQVGDVLNHIFEVKRFLARGGMGEVFEGANVNTDERVAIKVMLPALAADEKVVAMFRKEARTLTKLQHEALVSYRVLAQEPQLGVLYIVTEFIEGVELADMLGKVERSPDELLGLLRRLASGLGAAHKLGAIHRDMSPDNVLLPNGDVHQAKIIDFGIAKDLDASAATIVGDGFAGKLNYVAPEQLGDYGRDVGPWTDVYSLALVILAVAQGKNVNMSGSLVDAIDKRRKGPDLTGLPDRLRPLLEAMLRPDPKDRLRSMDEVVAMAGGAPVPAAPPPPGPAPGDTSTPGGGGAPKGLIVGGVVAGALALAAAGGWFMMNRGGEEPAPVPGPGPSIPAPPDDPTAAARNAINSVLPSVTCTWLDIGSIQASGDGVMVAMRGVAGDADAAQAEVARALGAAGVQNARLDFGDVAPINAGGCAALDTYRQIRASSDYHLSVGQPRFEMVMQPPGSPYAGEEAANAVINFNFGNPSLDFAILGIEPSGAIATLIPSRSDFEAVLAQSVDGRPIANDGGDRYRLNIDLDHEGWSGIIMLTGRGPFPPDVAAPPVGSRGPDWQQQFLSAAAQGNWRAEMVWFQSVNRTNEGEPPPPEGDDDKTE